MNRMENCIHGNISQMKIVIAILIPDKVGFKRRSIKNSKVLCINGENSQEDIVLNIH
jgi:hypothetical protein